MTRLARRAAECTRPATRRKKKPVEVGGCAVALFLVDDEVFALARHLHPPAALAQQGHAARRPGDLPRPPVEVRPARPASAEDQDGCQPTYAVQVTEDGTRRHVGPAAPATGSHARRRRSDERGERGASSSSAPVRSPRSPPARCAAAASAAPIDPGRRRAAPALPAAAAVQGVPRHGRRRRPVPARPGRGARPTTSPCAPASGRRGSPPTGAVRARRRHRDRRRRRRSSPPAAGRGGCPGVEGERVHYLRTLRRRRPAARRELLPGRADRS